MARCLVCLLLLGFSTRFGIYLGESSTLGRATRTAPTRPYMGTSWIVADSPCWGKKGLGVVWQGVRVGLLPLEVGVSADLQLDLPALFEIILRSGFV